MASCAEEDRARQIGEIFDGNYPATSFDRASAEKDRVRQIGEREMIFDGNYLAPSFDRANILASAFWGWDFVKNDVIKAEMLRVCNVGVAVVPEIVQQDPALAKRFELTELVDLVDLNWPEIRKVRDVVLRPQF